MSIGIAGTLVNTGIGSLIDDLKRNLPITSHYVMRHPTYGIDARKRDSTCVFPRDERADLEGWIRKQRVVFFVEQPIHADLVAICKAHKVPTVCLVDIDWFNPELPWVKDVTVFTTPNMTSFTLLTKRYGLGNVHYIPAVVDLRLFPFRQRTRCDTFLFNNGWGGYKNRKGGDIIQQVVRSSAGKLLVHSQAEFTVASTKLMHVDVQQGNFASRSALYAYGDVYLAPTRWEGYGLHIVEALASGMPVLVTKGPPMTDYVTTPEWHIETDAPEVVTQLGRGRFTPIMCTPKTASLVARMQHWRGKDIRVASLQARRAAESFSWDTHGKAYQDLIRKLLT